MPGFINRPRALILLLAALWLGASAMAMHYRSLARSFVPVPVSEETVAGQQEPMPSPSRALDSVTAIEPDQVEGDEIVMPAERIVELEDRLAAREQEIRDLRRRLTQHDSEMPAAREDRRRAWMDELRETDPERYAEITAQREQSRQRMRDSFAHKAAFFLNRDRSLMTAEEQDDYEYMLGLLAQTWELAETMQQADLPREERWRIGRTVFANVRELTPMLEAERDREFYQLALDMGYEDDDAAAFVDYINDMIEISTFSSIWQRQRGGPR